MKRIILMLALSIGASMAIADHDKTAKYNTETRILLVPQASINGSTQTFSVALQNIAPRKGDYLFQVMPENVTLTPPLGSGNASITLSLDVTNSTDQAFDCIQTYAVDKTNVTTTIPVGETAKLASNTHDAAGTVTTCYIKPPLAVDQANPGDGNFAMTYGYWNNSAHVTCNNDCNNGYPTDTVNYEGNNWKYVMQWDKTETEVFNSVTFTTDQL